MRAAEDPEERDALSSRYRQASQDADARGCGQNVRDFETAINTSSKAVITRSVQEMYRLASSDNELYATFYQLLEAEVRLPTGEKWDVLRRVADEALFPGYRKTLRFAALSLDGIGLSNYGDCSFTLREHLTAHRASLFHENSVVFMERQGILMGKAHQLPRGYRSTWGERAKLCVAKLANQMGPTTVPNDFPLILVKQGATSADDAFVEVHVWGPISRRTVERVVVTRRRRRPSQAILRGLALKLRKVGVNLEVR